MEFNNEYLITQFKTRRFFWGVAANVSEEHKELAWRRIADFFGFFFGIDAMASAITLGST